MKKPPASKTARLAMSHIGTRAARTHAIKMDSFRDVWMLRDVAKYVAFVLMGESFLRSAKGLLCLNLPSDKGKSRSARKGKDD